MVFKVCGDGSTSRAWQFRRASAGTKEGPEVPGNAYCSNFSDLVVGASGQDEAPDPRQLSVHSSLSHGRFYVSEINGRVRGRILVRSDVKKLVVKNGRPRARDRKPKAKAKARASAGCRDGLTVVLSRSVFDRHRSSGKWGHGSLFLNSCPN